MEVENFKQQQQDRADEGKELKREDELTDLSQIATNKLPGAENKSLLTKISEGLHNVATTISDKIGYNPIIEGHEDLDRDVKRQVKKINKEIESKYGQGGHEAKPSEWEKSLPDQIKKEADNAKESAEGLAKNAASKVEGQAKEGTSLLGKVQQGAHGLSDSIAQGVQNLKSKFSKEDDANEREDDGTKKYRTVQDGFEQSVDDLKHEKRVEELGQAELKSQNPFKPLDSGDNKEQGENQSLGGKIKESLNNAGNKITTQVEGATQKVKATFASKAPQDKENAQQIA